MNPWARKNELRQSDMPLWDLEGIIAQFDDISGEDLCTVQTQGCPRDGQSGEETTREGTKIEVCIRALVDCCKDISAQPVTKDFGLGKSNGEKGEENQTHAHTEDYFPTLFQSLLALRSGEGTSSAVTKVFHNLVHDIRRRAVGYEGDICDKPACRLHDFLSYDFTHTPVCSLHEDIGNEIGRASCR